MELSELRIGNCYRWYAEGEYYFFQIEAKDFSNDNYKNFEPIPLDESILLSCGFEKWENVIVNEYESYERFVLYNVVGGTSNYEVHIIHSNYGGENHTEICYYIDSDERQTIEHTEHLHNLQNAFHLALGYELEINLKELTKNINLKK